MECIKKILLEVPQANPNSPNPWVFFESHMIFCTDLKLIVEFHQSFFYGVSMENHERSNDYVCDGLNPPSSSENGTMETDRFSLWSFNV